MRRRYVPRRGDIVWLSFTPQAGYEQAADQVKSLDWRAQHAEFVGHLPDAPLNDVLGMASALLSDGEA